MNTDNNRGRKSTVTLTIGFKDFMIKLKDSKIQDCFYSCVRPLSNSGAYVPMPQKFINKKVFVVILED